MAILTKAHVVGHVFGGLVFLAVLVPVYHLFIEDRGPIWVNTRPPELLDIDVKAFQPGRLKTKWAGYRRRACDEVEWAYILHREPDNAKMWHARSPATAIVETTEAEEARRSISHFPFPPVRPGDYRYQVLELARCNPWKSWRNQQAEFAISVSE